jgi:hypothetical protein
MFRYLALHSLFTILKQISCMWERGRSATGSMSRVSLADFKLNRDQTGF